MTESPTSHPRLYVEAGTDADVFLTPDGHLTLRLRPYWDTGGEHILRLFDTKTGLMVGPTDRRLAKLGILSVQIRGERYYHRACKEGDFSPGSPVLLRPEPKNPHDAHAVAVVDQTGHYRCGYLNKQKARSYPALVEAEGSLTAISVRGTGPGDPCPQVGIIAGSPATMDTLLS